ncbi:twin-arginine translocation signal domain-containing protein [Adlercreutzia mucosicola]|uniref:twin-arginine translocation signal domain-containing protein n=1 Tax=Adlercreutzia mucosicola TaxID=580026 RepID=UPI000480FC27|nr:twin-arginine translocation signal domain-containing protein [Adlercreutzia mucosicola]MCR2035475.1 twin-arginine translocation signal domain-containing protein [Adlercreutzia mucosicola]
MTRTSDHIPTTGISRRTFCKGAAVLGIWGGLASFGLTSCAPPYVHGRGRRRMEGGHLHRRGHGS